MKQRHLIGTIIRPHGIAGELLIALNEDTDIPVGSPVWIGYSNTYAQPYIVEAFRTSSQRAIIRLQGITTRDKAEYFREQGVFVEAVSRDNRKTHNMRGWQVRMRNGGVLGMVIGVEENPAHPLLRIVLPEGNEVLIPQVETFITSIEPENQTITVDLPEGLLSVQVASPKITSRKRKR